MENSRNIQRSFLIRLVSEIWQSGPDYQHHVEGEQDKPFESKNQKPKQEKKTSPELEQYQKEAQALLDSYSRFFTTFARDVSLRFKLSNGFFIDLEKGEVNLATQWFAEKGFNKEQILWAVLHELSHFRDLAEDPEYMMKNFEYIRKQAKKTGETMMQKWEQAFGSSDSELIGNLKKQRPASAKDPSVTMNAVEQAAYKIHHTFYNIFDDIYVNNLVARKAPVYEQQEKGGQEVIRLYREKLFAKTDYSQLPRHLQFTYTLLREEMVKDEQVITSDEVTQALEQKILFQGKDYTPRQLVEQFLLPKANRDTKAGQRYFLLQKTLEPIFEKLLLKDLEDWQPKKPQKQEQQPGEGEGESEPGQANPFSGDYKEFEENNPDQFDDQNIGEWADKHEQDQKEAKVQKATQSTEENKSTEEKAKEGQEKIDKQWAEKNNLNYETLKKFRKLENEVAPYLQDLSELWQSIVFASSRNVERELEGHYRTGTELDIQKTINEWPEIQKHDLDKVEVMKRMVSKEVLVKKPDLIRVRISGDLSGSMDKDKRHILQQCFVLLLSSLNEFNTYLNLTRKETKSKLEVDTEAWIFGNDAIKIKQLRSDSGLDDEQIEMIRIFEKLDNTIGLTYNNAVLEKINESLTLEDRDKIAQDKIMEMVFEITDGGSSNPIKARQEVDSLLESKVIVRAFQIGVVDAREKELFNQVWNTNREEKLGEIVGEHIENLLPAITKLLKHYLGNVKL